MQNKHGNNDIHNNVKLFTEESIIKENDIPFIIKDIFDESKPSSSKEITINSIINTIQHNRMLSEVFATVNRNSIYIHLINLFELEENNIKLQLQIEKLIHLFLNNITISKEVYERLFQYCKQYYNNPYIQKENIEKCLTLLNLFYPKQQLQSKSEPKNYFAFYNPNNEGIIINNKEYEISHGINFILSFKIQKQNIIQQQIISLVSIHFNNEKINPININILNKEDKSHLALDTIIFEFSENNQITFDYNIYYAITFMIHPVNNSLCVFINDSQEHYEYFFKQKIFNSSCKDIKISKLIFFKHFYGEVTSIITIKKCLMRSKLWTTGLNKKMNMFINGLWNKKSLEMFIKIIETDDILSNIDIQNTNKRSYIKGEDIINFIFVPFNNDNNSKKVNDVYNNVYGQYQQGICNHTYKNIFKHIESLGGVWNLIPLFEMICFYCINNYNNKTEYNNELILKFLDIVNNIIENNEQNVIELFSSNFFDVISLFIHQSKIAIQYNDELINKFLFIGDNMFKNMNTLSKDNKVHKIKKVDDNKNDNKICYIMKECLFEDGNNSKIKLFKKYKKEYYSMFIFNEDILKFFPPQKILLILKHFDENLLSLVFKNSTLLFLINFINPINCFCCEKHINEYKDEFIINNKVISKNEQDILQEILNIVSLIFKKKIQIHEKDQNFTKTSKILFTILNILAYNLTPCFQIFLIKLLHTELTNNKRSYKWIINAIESIVNYHISIIIGNLLYLGSLHVRKEIIKLILTIYDIIFTISNNKEQIISEQIKLKFNSFLYSIKHCYLCDETYFLETKKLNINKDIISSIAKHCVIQLKSHQKQLNQCDQYTGTVLAFKEELYNQYIKDLYNNLSLLIFNNNYDYDEYHSLNNTKHFNSNILLSLIIITTHSKQVSILIDFLQKMNEQFNNKNGFKDYEMLLNSKSFLRFLFDLNFIRSSFHKSKPQYETNEQSEKILKLSRKIYLNLLNEAIIYFNKNPPLNKNEKYYPIDSVETLLKWGNIMLLTLSIRQEILFSFLTEYLIEISIEILKVIKIDKFVSFDKKTNFLYENYFRFVNFAYYFYAHYKLDSGIILNSENFVESRFSSSFFDRKNLISGLKLSFSNTNNYFSIINIWQDYYIFHEFYFRFNNLWSDKKIVNTYYKEDSTSYIKKIIKKYCIEKKKSNIHLNEILNICNVNNDMYKLNGNKISLLIILVNTFPMILIIIDTIVKNEDDFNKWFNEYHNFLLYIIISINNFDDNCDEFIFIHEQCLDAIVFSISFLTKFKPETKGFQTKVDKLLIKVFKYILLFLKKSNVDTTSNTKMKNCLINIFYNYFTEMSHDIMHEMEKNDYKGVLHILNNEIFEKYFFTNEKLKQRINANINTWKHYAIIVSQRYSSNQELNLAINFSFKTTLNQIVHQGEIEKMIYERDICLERKRKTMFKLVMKKYQEMFLFQQFWSDKSLFYDNLRQKFVKYKVVNFLCEDYEKPFIKPFIDIRNNLPKFLHSKINETFNYESNIDDYYDFNIENKFKKVMQVNSNEISISKYNKSYLINNFIYKTRDFLLKEYHTLLYNTINTKQIEDIYLNYTIKTNPETQIVLQCCLVKLTYHIKGIVIIDKQNQIITFHAKLSSNACIGNQVKNDKLCIGSLFEIPSKISSVKFIIIPYNQINVLLRYTYYYKRTGVSLITQNNKQYLINFHNEIDRENFLKEIISTSNFSQLVNDFIEKSQCCKINFDKDSGVIIGYFNKKWNKHKNNLYKLSKTQFRLKLKKILKKWKNHKITNFKLLMILNFLGNRSYLDITQYPVFPWIFNSHLISDSLDLPMNNNIQTLTVYRDLSLPVGMFSNENNPGLKSDVNSNENWLYNHGTNYSNQVYLSYYLLRLFPFYSINVEIHDQHLDSAQRLFFSLESSFKSILSKGDVRELIPEFFTCPEMFLNVNNFFFENDYMNNCNTPCESNQYEFVSKKKRGIESIEVTNNIFKWIDLIFGYKQKGKEGLKANNIFIKSAYFEDIDLHNYKNNMELLYTLLEFGLIPAQLFPKEVNMKYIRKIKPGTKYEMYINNENEENDDIYNMLTTIEKGNEIIGFAIIDNCKTVLQKNINSVRKISVDSIFVEVDQISAIAKGLDIEKRKRENTINKERFSLFHSESNYDKVIHTLSLMNNNYLYITSICINKKDKSQCKSVIIKKSTITKSIPLCKMELTCDKKNKLIYNFISFSEDCTEIIISGFNDRKIIIVSLSLNEKGNDIEIESYNIYSKYFTSPLITTCYFMYWENTYLLIGDQNGNLFLLKKHSHLKYVLMKVIHDHLHEIKYITYNSHLKCVATSSKDGFVNLYLVPSFKLLNSFQIIKNLSIDKVFLFHTPLYCLIAYCKEMDTLFCHSLNIEQILYEYEPDGEQSLEINNPIVIKKGNANEYIAFVNEKNEILILSIPEMNLVKKKKIDFKIHMVEYSKEDNVLIVIDKGLERMAYVEIWG